MSSLIECLRMGIAAEARRAAWVAVLAVVAGPRWIAAAEPPPVPPVRVAYFVPADRKPLPRYEERLDRVMTEVQRFYREGMNGAGYGPRTFRLERDERDRLRVHLARGRHPMQTYGRDASDAVRREVQAALSKQRVDLDRDTWVIFQVLLRWDGDRATEVGPYCGGGSHLAGTAWVYDDERLDARLLGSKAPGGYYGQPCSLGEFNSHYVGGVAHELGHAFGLPHDCQRLSDSKRGLSLMGGGNHTYGQEQRGEGPGTFLSAASAMMLASSRPFAGDREDARRPPSCRLSGLDARFADGKLVLTGRVAAQPAASGIAAFNDWAQVPGDYDAVSWTCPIQSDGGFRLEVGEMRPGLSQLRLRVCHANGTASEFAFDYQVDSKGKPDCDVFRHRLALDEAVEAYAAGDRARAESLAAELGERFSHLPEVRRKAAHLQALLKPAPLQPLLEIPAKDGWVPLSGAKPRSDSVGWGRPLRDEVLIERPGQCFLQVGGQFFERGLFAHAPAKHEWDLARQWQRFRTAYGVQDGHEGSVVFVVLGDGRELHRSAVVRDHTLGKVEVDVRGVDVLELAVEDGGDGAHSDWGVWISPELGK